MQVRELQSAAAFASFQVEHDGDSVVVDLVADPVAGIEPPLRVTIGAVTIQIDSAHEVLVNKLCALLHRSELRDLMDIQELLARGGDLPRAVADAPRKDGGFSALTLGFTLGSWGVAAAARAAGLESRAEELERCRDELLRRVADGRP